MIRKFIVMLSLCCLVLCAFVGFLSMREIEEAKKSQEPAVPTNCEEILENRPTETGRMLIREFVPGKHFATVDTEDDGQWEQLCVPFFPKKRSKVKHSYRAVIVCFKNVPTREALKELVASGEIDAKYLSLRQNLDVYLHSQLAQQYKNMDFSNSPVFYRGFKASNPVLGETSLKVSMVVGAVAILAAVLALLAGLFVNRKSDSLNGLMPPDQNTNRAGLPLGNELESVSILDRVKSRREQHPTV